MKINSINHSTSILKQNTENNSSKKAPAFRGSFPVALASFIENNGFMGEFLTIDTTGMGIPRATQGYLRNRKELGHLNYKAGREEVTRELLSGPAFFFVPLLTTTAFALAKGKAALVSHNSLEVFQKLMSKTSVNLKDAAQTKKNFVKTLIGEAFGNYTKDRELVENLSELMEKRVTNKFSIVDKIRNLGRKQGDKLDTKNVLKDEAENVLTKLNKSNEKLLDSAGCLKLDGYKKPVSVKTLMTEMADYLDDFTEKAAKTTKGKDKFIKDFHNSASILRTVAEVSSIGALSAFIAYIPKLYQTGEHFPGTDGLLPEEPAQQPTSEKQAKEAV